MLPTPIRFRHSARVLAGELAVMLGDCYNHLHVQKYFRGNVSRKCYTNSCHLSREGVLGA